VMIIVLANFAILGFPLVSLIGSKLGFACDNIGGEFVSTRVAVETEPADRDVGLALINQRS
jgi:hypothetical protein